MGEEQASRDGSRAGARHARKHDFVSGLNASAPGQPWSRLGTLARFRPPRIEVLSCLVGGTGPRPVEARASTESRGVEGPCAIVEERSLCVVEDLSKTSIYVKVSAPVHWKAGALINHRLFWLIWRIQRVFLPKLA